MNKKIEQILDMWHKHFSDEKRQYAEFESSDIEYFVGCLLYNNFAFSKALETMQTIDLSYDFLSECGDEYDEIKDIIKTLEFDNELEKLKFLQNYIEDVKSKYTASELYLLNRLQYHVNGMAQRYLSNKNASKTNFQSSIYR